jgi:hypothetical protein
MRILVLLTDGPTRLEGSLSGTIAAARPGVVVYASPRAEAESAAHALASATGGKVFDAADTGSLGSTYQALSRELDRTWQISYLTTARPGDRLVLSVRAAGRRAAVPLQVPGSKYGPTKAGSVARSGKTALVVVLLVALLLSAAGVAANRRLRKSEIRPLVDKHVKGGERRTGTATAQAASSRCSPGRSARSRSCRAPSGWRARSSALGIDLRVGHLPYSRGSRPRLPVSSSP